MDTELFGVVGMANGDLITWRGVRSTNRIRLAHPGGVFDISGNTTTLVSGGKDCVIRVWEVAAFKGSSTPQSRAIACKAMVQDRAACIRSVCCGEGARQSKIYAGLASNDILEVSSVDASEYTRITQGHTVRHDSRVESREWIFTFHEPSNDTLSHLENLKDAAATNFIKYRQMPGESKANLALAGASTNVSVPIKAWHALPDTVCVTRIQGFVQFKTQVTASRVCELLPGAIAERATRQKKSGSSGNFHVYLESLNRTGLGDDVQNGSLDEGVENDADCLLQHWPVIALCADPAGLMGASAGRDGTVRVWALPISRKADEEAREDEGLRFLKDLQEDLLCIAWSQDSQALAVGSAKGSVCILNAHNLSVRTWQTGDYPASHSALSVVTAMSFRPDGQYLASTGLMRYEGTGAADGQVELQVSVLISFVGKKRVPGGSKDALQRIEKGLLPSQKARGIPVSIDWSHDGCYLQVATSAREVLYWSALKARALNPKFRASDGCQPTHSTDEPGFEIAGDGREGAGSAAGNGGASLEDLRAWDEFETSQLVAATSRCLLLPGACPLCKLLLFQEHLLFDTAPCAACVTPILRIHVLRSHPHFYPASQAWARVEFMANTLRLCS